MDTAAITATMEAVVTQGIEGEIHDTEVQQGDMDISPALCLLHNDEQVAEDRIRLPTAHFVHVFSIYGLITVVLLFLHCMHAVQALISVEHLFYLTTV